MVGTGACCETYPKPKDTFQCQLENPIGTKSLPNLLQIFLASVVLTPFPPGRETDATVARLQQVLHPFTFPLELGQP